MLRLLCLNLLESEMVLFKGDLKELGSVSFYDFELLPHSPLGDFICESIGCVV